MSFFGLGKSHKPMADVELLATIYDFGMRSVIESILRDADIPYILKHITIINSPLPYAANTAIISTER